jgi:hypothetical protein
MYPPPDIKPFAQLPPKSYYFADKERLVEHCKRFGLLIYTRRDPSRERHVIDTENLPFWGASEHTFFPLPVAVVPPEEDGQAPLGGVGRAASKAFVTGRLLDALQEELVRGDENSSVRRLSTWPIQRAFVYLDVSDFSKYPPGQEVLIINSIVGIVEHPDYWSALLAYEARNSVEAMLCIGDGYIFVIKNPVLATFFAAYLARLTEILVARKETLRPFRKCLTSSGLRGVSGDSYRHFRKGLLYVSISAWVSTSGLCTASGTPVGRTGTISATASTAASASWRRWARTRTTWYSSPAKCMSG